MKTTIRTGDMITFRTTVRDGDVAAFNGEVVHAVYGTFAVARDAEWTTRQFVLQLRDDDEEGIGTRVSVEHVGPAFVGEEIIFTATVVRLDGHELICSYEARVGERLVARGETGQKILKRSTIARILGQTGVAGQQQQS